MFKDTRFGETVWWLYPPDDVFMRVPQKIVDCIVFLGRNIIKSGEDVPLPRGTGFFIGIPSESFPGTSYIYLVTASHTAKMLSLDGGWFARLNSKHGGIVDLQVADGSGWMYHPTDPDNVDVAVHRMPNLNDEVESAFIPQSAFATDEVIRQQYLGYGDMVFFSGVLSKMTGRQKNIPVVRTGNIAMMPDELVPICIDGKSNVESEVYIVEARSLGGLSGCPVFARQTVRVTLPLRKPGEDQLTVATAGASETSVWLLGVMHGHWDIKKEDFDSVELPLPRKGEDPWNLGFAIVVPAKKIIEILYQPSAIMERRQADEARKAREFGTTPD